MEALMNPDPPPTELTIGKDLIEKAAITSDQAIISIGKNAGEGKDRDIESSYYLTDNEKILIKNVADAFHTRNKKVIVVLNIAGPVDVMQWRDNADAILIGWQPGLEGGNAMADILSGKVNPSGKLATTFAAAYTDDPTARNFPGKTFKDKPLPTLFGVTPYEAEVTYEEGVYVGYRYYNTFNVKPAYEFGYGMSYTDFTYSPVTMSAPAFTNELTASVTVTNSGKFAGKEVVQLYISAPTKALDKPSAELKAFAKTGLLKPGESQTLTFTLTVRDLTSFQTKTSSWVADAGTYTVRIGTSQNVKQSASFKVPKTIVAEKVHKAVAPKIEIHELVYKPTGKK